MVDLPIHIQQIIVLCVTISMVILLLLERFKPSYVFFSASLIFILCGIIGADDFLQSLSNESILCIFLLVFITSGLREHFNIVGFFDKLFGKKNTPRKFLLKMTSSVATLSSFLNNTPIVALLMPYVYQWSKRNNMSPSKFLIPLSFATICGGMITVIGTSTNLVLNGLIQSKGMNGLAFFRFFYTGCIGYYSRCFVFVFL